MKLFKSAVPFPSILVLALVGIVGIPVVWSAITATPAHSVAMAEATVKLEMDGGYGSGAHIGNGYVLTAAHVADSGVLNAKLTDGRSLPTELVILNKKYDFAIVRIVGGDPGALAEVDLAGVAGTKTGDKIVAEGYPDDFDLLAIHGTVMGAVTGKFWNNWPAIIPMHITGAPGISGGPVFNENHEIVGIFVTGKVPWGGTGGAVPVTILYELLGGSVVRGFDGRSA